MVDLFILPRPLTPNPSNQTYQSKQNNTLHHQSFLTHITSGLSESLGLKCTVKLVLWSCTDFGSFMSKGLAVSKEIPPQPLCRQLASSFKKRAFILNNRYASRSLWKLLEGPQKFIMREGLQSSSFINICASNTTRKDEAMYLRMTITKRIFRINYWGTGNIKVASDP